MKYALLFWLLSAAPALADGCALDPRSAPDRPLLLPGVVRGPATEAEVLSGTRIAIERTHAPVSPKYVNLPRVVVFYELGGVQHATIAAVLDGILPQPGDPVTIASRYRDPDAACAFIPWTVVKTRPAKPVA